LQGCEIVGLVRGVRAGNYFRERAYLFHPQAQNARPKLRQQMYLWFHALAKRWVENPANQATFAGVLRVELRLVVAGLAAGFGLGRKTKPEACERLPGRWQRKGYSVTM
jgi:hypothetical protein